MTWFRLFVLFALCLPILADSGLDSLRATLIGMRGKSPDSGGPRGATPALTVVKHQLRDWAESRLKSLALRGDEGELERQLNKELREAKMICDDSAADQPRCPDWTLLGFLADLKFRRSRGFLILQTGVGIECGFDESAYLYSWTDEGWRRVWQNEQTTYAEKEYKPQSIEAVSISPYNRANDYVLLTLGVQSWCSSGWHDVYYRAFRLGPDPSAPPMVEGDEWAYIAVDPPIQGSVTRDEMFWSSSPFAALTPVSTAARRFATTKSTAIR